MFNSKLLATALFFSTLLFSCSDTTYQANVQFLFSQDGGSSYGNSTIEYQTGQRIYALIILEAIANPAETREINVRITIPSKDEVLGRYFDGEIVTPIPDSVNNKTYYDVTITTNTGSIPWRYVFQFIANSATDLTMTVDFGEPIPSNYDKQKTISFVQA